MKNKNLCMVTPRETQDKIYTTYSRHHSTVY